MSSNDQKTPFGRSLNIFSMQRFNDYMQQTGRSLPCTVKAVSGSIVTVNFEIVSDFTLPQIQVPLFGPEYIRYPIQVGDKGVVFSADARLGAMTGLGGGVADLSSPSNLGALVFFPIGNKNWTSVDSQSVTIYGPNGVVLRDTGSNTTLTLTPSGVVVDAQTSITLQVGTTSIIITAAGVAINGALTMNGAIITGTGTGAGDLTMSGTATFTGTTTINGREFLAHEHSGVQTGPYDTGGVV